MVRLEDGVDFKCPRPDCGHGWSIESWDTEYGDPQPGIHQVYCSKCDRHFKIEVAVQVYVTAYYDAKKEAVIDRHVKLIEDLTH